MGGRGHRGAHRPCICVPFPSPGCLGSCQATTICFRIVCNSLSSSRRSCRMCVVGRGRAWREAFAACSSQQDAATTSTPPESKFSRGKGGGGGSGGGPGADARRQERRTAVCQTARRRSGVGRGSHVRADDAVELPCVPWHDRAGGGAAAATVTFVLLIIPFCNPPFSVRLHLDGHAPLIARHLARHGVSTERKVREHFLSTTRPRADAPPARAAGMEPRAPKQRASAKREAAKQRVAPIVQGVKQVQTAKGTAATPVTRAPPAARQ